MQLGLKKETITNEEDVIKSRGFNAKMKDLDDILFCSEWTLKHYRYIIKNITAGNIRRISEF